MLTLIVPRWTNSQRCFCTVYLGWWTFLFQSNVNKQLTSMFCLFCYFFHWNSIFCCFYLAYFCVDKIYSMPHFEHICSSFWIDMGVNSVWSYRYIHRQVSMYNFKCRLYSGHSSFLPQEDHPNANIGAKKHD